MSDLNARIKAWRDAFKPGMSAADLDELEDHLRQAFAALADAGYTEVSRVHLPAEHTYTYWDYQQLRFPRNEGMRIDLTYASPALAAAVTGVTIERNERKGKGPSDHVPVVLEVATP